LIKDRYFKVILYKKVVSDSAYSILLGIHFRKNAHGNSLTKTRLPFEHFRSINIEIVYIKSLINFQKEISFLLYVINFGQFFYIFNHRANISTFRICDLYLISAKRLFGLKILLDLSQGCGNFTN
jgi:hypothetical protein